MSEANVKPDRRLLRPGGQRQKGWGEGESIYGVIDHD